MKEIKFSINSWIFGKAPIEEIALKAKQIGAEGLEISGEPDTTDIVRVKEALRKYDLTAFSISGNFLEEERAFNHNDPKYRNSAIEYGKKCVDMAVQLGAKRVLLVPSQVNRLKYFVSKEEDWKNAVQAVGEVADYAKKQGSIVIMLECVNKYEVSMVRTLEDGIRMAEDTKRDNVKIIGDTFHMQLEEEIGIHNAIRRAGKDWLVHLHLGDNTREVPGKGSINWREIFLALNDINYEAAVSFEPLPQKLTPEDIFNGDLNQDELVKDLAFSLNYIKLIMQSIR
ncbi:MAG TPA: hypothetical protein DDW65_16340 [Firmicutes bacterium]|jgi:D-psicose/D-tagatose/L-ribulose 3-epimerase|nr:hypothetical protein [Bacillota bacterium]